MQHLNGMLFEIDSITIHDTIIFSPVTNKILQQ